MFFILFIIFKLKLRGKRFRRVFCDRNKDPVCRSHPAVCGAATLLFLASSCNTWGLNWVHWSGLGTGFE